MLCQLIRRKQLFIRFKAKVQPGSVQHSKSVLDNIHLHTRGDIRAVLAHVVVHNALNDNTLFLTDCLIKAADQMLHARLHGWVSQAVRIKGNLGRIVRIKLS